MRRSWEDVDHSSDAIFDEYHTSRRQDTVSTKFIAFSFGKKNKISKAKNLKQRIVRKLKKEAQERGSRKETCQREEELAYN